MTVEAPRYTIGLGWNANKSGEKTFDIDTSVFMLKDGKMRSDEDFIYYNSKESKDGSIIHTGDNLTGDGDDSLLNRLYNLNK